MKEQFSGASSDDVAAHLNNFVELCEMQKYKDVDGNIIKLKLFPFSLRGRAKDWLLSLPRNSIDSWDKCKDAFIGKYYLMTHKYRRSQHSSREVKPKFIDLTQGEPKNIYKP
jgi:hypothetical protein